MTQLSSSLNATGGDSVDNEHSTWRRDVDKFLRLTTEADANGCQCVEVTNGLRIYRRVTEPSQRPAIDQLRQYFDQRGRTTASEATDCDDFSIVTRASLEKNGFPENYFSQIAQEAPAHRGTITTKNSPVRKDGSAGRQATEPQASDKLVNPARSGPSEVPENHDFGDSGVQNQWTEQPNLPDDFFTDQSNGGAEARIGWPTEFQVQPMPGRYGQSGEPLTYRNAPSPLSHADNAEPRLATFSFGFIAPHPLQYRQQAPNHDHTGGVDATSSLGLSGDEDDEMIHWASQRFPTDDARRLEAKYICPLHGCGSTFVRHFNLRVHMQSHSGQKPFKCEWPGCGELFSRQLDCKRHELRHHNIGSYTCQGCRQQFADMDSLNHHRVGCTECPARQPIVTSFHGPNKPFRRIVVKL